MESATEKNRYYCHGFLTLTMEEGTRIEFRQGEKIKKSQTCK